MIIRTTTPRDLAQIRALYPLAFPQEDLTRLVGQLLDSDAQVLSLAGFHDDTLMAHILFSFGGTEPNTQNGALLGPLAVKPSHQKQGYGSTLVRTGLDHLAATGIAQVFVLGDPRYYRRFGFAPDRTITPPCPIPDAWAEALQSLVLAQQPPLKAGTLFLPTPWRDPALWGP